MSRPKRFQARRGQKLEPGQKQVGRNTLWGNPYPVEGMVDPAKPPRLVQRYADQWGESVASLMCTSDQEAVARYRKALLAGRMDYDPEQVRGELSGYDLGCPCGLEHCHADVLLEVANPPRRG